LGLLAQWRYWVDLVDSFDSVSLGKGLVLGVRRPGGALLYAVPDYAGMIMPVSYIKRALFISVVI
jgi:hypothetical protein